ncbi:Nitrogen permease reactivator protein [Saitoella coloradoensis]
MSSTNNNGQGPGRSSGVKFSLTPDIIDSGAATPMIPREEQDRFRVPIEQLEHMRVEDLTSKRFIQHGGYDTAYSLPCSRVPSLATDTETPTPRESAFPSAAGSRQPTPPHSPAHLPQNPHSLPGPSALQREQNLPKQSGVFTPEDTLETPPDPDNPYKRSRRQPQSHSLADIAPQFIFKKLAHLGDRSRNSSHKSLKSLAHEESTGSTKTPRGSSMDLKRFFKIGNHHHKPSEKDLPKAAPAPMKSNTPSNLPFGDDHAGLFRKYGKFGKVLGAGAGGSVRLMKRAADGTTFAVKEFRAKTPYETDREYAKKVTAEFCVGSALHHPNIIETLDIVKEHGKYYEIMEYCPYDLFAIVMTGKMTQPEINCAFTQIVAGVAYLHNMGIAHRDLKLDNCVVNEHGIVKIIDFGSAAVFRYPFEEDIVEAHGIVGSDPYLSPEVCEQKTYDPRPADIWSIAIIFCCMTLRRFPWKAPRSSDSSYKAFASLPDADAIYDPATNSLLNNSSSHLDPHSSSSPSSARTSTSTSVHGAGGGSGSASIKGPWRLLRLLPYEARPLVHKMLELNPKRRAAMADLRRDDWLANVETCTIADGRLVQSKGHTHVLVGASEGGGKK